MSTGLLWLFTTQPAGLSDSTTPRHTDKRGGGFVIAERPPLEWRCIFTSIPVGGERARAPENEKKTMKENSHYYNKYYSDILWPVKHKHTILLYLVISLPIAKFTLITNHVIIKISLQKF